VQPVLDPDSKAELEQLTVMTDNGPTPISKVAELTRSEEPSLYYHKDGKTYIRVTANADAKELSVVGDKINKATKDLKLPEGVTLAVGGASADQSSDFADLGLTA